MSACYVTLSFILFLLLFSIALTNPGTYCYTTTIPIAIQSPIVIGCSTNGDTNPSTYAVPNDIPVANLFDSFCLNVFHRLL